MTTRPHRFLSTVAKPGKHTVLHAAVLTLIATAIFMMATAGEMGPMAPLIIALSFYLVFAAVAVEAFLGLFSLGRWFARQCLRKYA
jgi:hypothetical protein